MGVLGSALGIVAGATGAANALAGGVATGVSNVTEIKAKEALAAYKATEYAGEELRQRNNELLSRIRKTEDPEELSKLTEEVKKLKSDYKEYKQIAEKSRQASKTAKRWSAINAQFGKKAFDYNTFMMANSMSRQQEDDKKEQRALALQYMAERRI